MNGGFLGTAAPLTADLVLLLEIAMAVGLLIGAGLARAGRFRTHSCCQSIIVLLNLAVIVLTMAPSFHAQVLAGIPEKLGRGYYLFATAHAGLGAVTEIAALYILLSAGTNLLPEQLRFRTYRPWMRSVLVLWWVELLLGIATYIRWYVPHPFGI